MFNVNPLASVLTGDESNIAPSVAAINDALGAFGTAAQLDVPASGDAAANEVVKGNDSRLTDARTPATHNHDDRYFTEAEINSALGQKADLVGGKLVTSQLPSLAISEFLGSVASQVAMLALVGERGDWCLRSDLSASFVLIADAPSLIGSWQQILTPGSPVTSVNNQVGAVVLGASDVGASAVGHTHSIANTAGLQAALDAKDTNLATHAALVTTHGISAFGATLADDLDATTARQTLGLGTAATKDVGTGPNNVIQADSLGRLPAVDASQLLNVPPGTIRGPNYEVASVVASTVSGAVSAVLVTANRLYCVPFDAPTRVNTLFRILCTTGIAGATVRMGVHAMKPSGGIGEVLADLGTQPAIAAGLISFPHGGLSLSGPCYLSFVSTHAIAIQMGAAASANYRWGRFTGAFNQSGAVNYFWRSFPAAPLVSESANNAAFTTEFGSLTPALEAK